MEGLRCVTINANGIREPPKRHAFLQWLSQLTPHFACLQEAHILSCAEATSWFASSGFQAISSPGTSHSCGTILLYKPDFCLVNSWTDREGRFVQGEFVKNDITFRVAGVYAPNRNPERETFYSYIEDMVDPARPTILCGDFNAVLNRATDRRGSNPLNHAHDSCQALRTLFSNCCVTDIWRRLHPTERGFSWCKWDGSVASRINLIGCPTSWLTHALSCSLLPCPFSDHSAVFFNCSLPVAIPRGPGRWKLNCSLLESPDYINLIRTFWSSWRERKPSFPTLQHWWDEGKKRIRGISVNFSCKQSKIKSVTLTNLATHLKNRIDNGVGGLFDTYESVLSQLAAIDQIDAEGARVCSRVQWAEEGEASSSFFLRSEKKKGTDAWISAVKNANGEVVSGLNGILDSWHDFYLSLFTAGVTDEGVQEQLLGNLTARIPADQVSVCDGQLSMAEVLVALKGMSKGKAPGSDSLPPEFYLALWDVIGEDLVEMLNSSLTTGSLPLSLRTALISLIYKKGDRADHRKWRPISLLNADYKICARTLAGRLLSVLHYVIAPDQTCGVRGRFIGENVALLRDVVDFANEADLPVAILPLDQEKAFDRVDWAFLFRTLHLLGFGPSFISWIRLLYTEVRSAVLVNGYTSDFFKPTRGVRQGCPLSPLLYVITMEVLAANIRAHPHIRGLSLPRNPHPLPVLSLYADDTSVIVSSDLGILSVFEVYGSFEKGSGSKLNLGKCEGLWLGSWRDRAEAPVAINWTSSKIKVLGIFIGNVGIEEANWLPRIEAVRNCLNSWRHRALSFKGKTLVLNALALSKIWYVGSLVVMHPWAKLQLDKLIYDFLWSGKPDLVSREVVVQIRERGGLALVAMEKKIHALLVQWVKRFKCSPSGWVPLLTFWCLDRFGVPPHSVLASPSYFSLEALPPFYQAVFNAWRLSGGLVTLAGLAVGSFLSTEPVPVEAINTKEVYNMCLAASECTPHCTQKYSSSFPDIDWSSTWRSLYFMPLDRQVSDFNWRIGHGITYTADRLISFGYHFDPMCFCGGTETPEHLFFSCCLAQRGIAWLRPRYHLASPQAPAISSRILLFGFTRDELLCVHHQRLEVPHLETVKRFSFQRGYPLPPEAHSTTESPGLLFLASVL